MIDMKVAMIGQKGVASNAGGVEVHVEQLGRRLAALGHEVSVYTRPYYTDRHLKEYQGMKLISLPTIHSKNLDAIIHTFISSLHCLFKGYDVIHYHALGPMTLSFIPKLFGKKVVCTIHGLDWKREKWGALAKVYLKLGELTASRFPDKVIVVSEVIKKYMQEKYGKEYIYIPNGANMPCRRPPDIITQKYNLKTDGYILFLARLVPEKGAHHLISAYKKLATDKKLVIAGAASHMEEYEKQLKALAAGNENIIFTGFVSGAELDELYTNAYIYVLPSETEGLPISLLEALSYGQSAVVSDIEENREVISDKGFLFESKNVESLHEVLSFVCENPSLVHEKRLWTEGYVLEKYNWDSIAQQTEQIYRKVTGKRD